MQTKVETDPPSISEAEVAELAYQKWLARGCAHGFDREDWFAALTELTAGRSG